MIKLPYFKGVETIPQRLKIIRKTIADIEALPPTLGSKWQEGMLKYYRAVEAELKSYGTGKNKSK